MWKRGEIAPKEQFLLFSTLFYIYISNFRSQITHSFVKCDCSICCFSHSLNSDMSRYGYLEVFLWVHGNSRQRESTVPHIRSFDFSVGRAIERHSMSAEPFETVQIQILANRYWTLLTSADNDWFEGKDRRAFCCSFLKDNAGTHAFLQDCIFAQRRLRSACAFAQSDQSLRCTS